MRFGMNITSEHPLPVYEEHIIGGILHYREYDTSNWIPKTKRELTAMLMEARKKC